MNEVMITNVYHYAMIACGVYAILVLTLLAMCCIKYLRK